MKMNTDTSLHDVQDRLHTQVRAANRLVSCLRNILRGSKYQGRGAMRQRIDSILRTYDNALSSPAKAEQSSTPEHDKLWEEYQAYVAAQEPGEVHYTFSGWLAHVKPELTRNGYGPRQQQVLDGPQLHTGSWTVLPGPLTGSQFGPKAGFTTHLTPANQHPEEPGFVSEVLNKKVAKLLLSKDYMSAIKVVWSGTGCTLLGAKKYIDRLRGL